MGSIWLSVVVFVFTIMINGGPTDPVKSGPLILAVLLAGLSLTISRWLRARSSDVVE